VTCLDGRRSVLSGLASVATWGESDAGCPPGIARALAGLDDPRPGRVKDAEAIRGDWEAVMGDLDRAIRAGTVTADDFRRLGDAYGEHVKARTVGRRRSAPG
jgi:hypothetical protein